MGQPSSEHTQPPLPPDPALSAPERSTGHALLPANVGVSDADTGRGGSGAHASGGLLEGVVHGLRRRWRLGLALGLISSAVGAVAAWFAFAPSYTAFTQLRVAAQEPRLLASTIDGRSTTDFEIYKRTQRELIRSHFVLNAALRSPKVAQLDVVRRELDPVTWLEKNVRVDFPGEAEIMRISLSGPDPGPLAELANAVTKAYLSEVVGAERTRRLARVYDLERVYSEAAEKVRTGQTDLKSLADLVGTSDTSALAIKQQISLQQFAELQKAHSQVLVELMRAQIELDTQVALLKIERPKGASKPDEQPSPQAPQPAPKQADTSTEIPPLVVERQLDQHPDVFALRGKVAKLEDVLRNDEANSVPERRPEALVKRISGDREQLDKARASLTAKKEELRSQVVEELHSAFLAEQFAKNGTTEVSALAKLHAQVDVLTQTSTKLQSEVEKQANEAKKFGRSSVEVEIMRSKIEQSDKMAQQLAREIETLRVELQSPQRVSKDDVQFAEIPRVANAATRLTLTIMAAIFMLCLPLLGVAWWESRSRCVNSSSEVTNSIGLRVIGSLPVLPNRARRQMIDRDARAIYWQGLMRESLDTIRTILHEGREFEASRVLLVTSAESGEGKTTLAAELAISFARSGHRTLLVDFDLRRPAAHRLLELPNEQGMNEFLRGEVSLADMIRPTSYDLLWCACGGRCDEQSLGQLGRGQAMLQAFFDQLRREFDFVVVDSCPVLPLADAMMIGQHVDAAVLSVMRDVSHLPLIQEAYQRLWKVGVRVLGSVVTENTHGSYYKSRYRYVLQS